MFEVLCIWLSDDILFPALHAMIGAILLFSVGIEVWTRWRVGFGGARLIVRRSGPTMAVYFGTYAAISGLLVAICLSSDYAQDHRVFFAISDALAVFYLCLLNPWFRLKLLAFAAYLASAERR